MPTDTPNANATGEGATSEDSSSLFDMPAAPVTTEAESDEEEEILREVEEEDQVDEDAELDEVA